MTFDERVAELLRGMVEQPNLATKDGLNGALRLLAKWRSQLVANTIVARHGAVVQGGPFAGMRFTTESTEGGNAPRMLGCYEAELHPYISRIIGGGYRAVIDIGCAEGYYAVGFATRMPEAIVFAHDINEGAQRRCAELAQLNEVSDRVRVGGLFAGEDFARFENERTLVFLDAEGAEDELLRPDLFPALARLSILVECHDVFRPGLTARIAERFASTHSVERIEPELSCPKLPAWFANLGHLDQLLAIWEWRSGPTPWLFMTPRAG